MDKPCVKHWIDFKRVYCYPKDTSSYGITFSGTSGGDPSKIICTNFVDSDWAGDPDTCRSVSGYVFSFIGGAVSWSSHKQPVVILSTTEAKYRATVDAGKELIWLTKILGDLDVAPPSPMPLFSDNQGSIALANNPVFNARTRHIEVQCHSP